MDMNKGALMDFDDFFQHMTNKQPYDYQRLLAESDWFDVLIAPTGLGKTAAVIAAWLWRRQVKPQQTPRRLVYCLPMRTLVEQTEKNARCWLERLARAGLGQDLPSVDYVYVLMGGVEPPRDRLRWYEAPERPAILIGTQDMLISRALMRGYASGRARWPAEFALLHNDAFWVFDEVQLMGAGLATSVQLAAFRERLRSVLPTKSLWVSATLNPSWLRAVDFPGPQKVLRVPEDVPQDASSHAVRSLIEAHKPLAKAPVAPAGAGEAKIKQYIRNLADFVQKKRAPTGRTLVIVNTVDRAQKLRTELLKIGVREEKLVLIHSRFRPEDRRKQMDRLMTVDDAIAVATQAIEAGVDISSAVMITELAPWASLVQRFGRVNRYGERKKKEGGAPVYWVDLPAELAAPYEEKHLEEARKRLPQLQDAAPVKLGDPGRLDPPRRVIRQKDLIDLFDTDPDLTGFDVDISPYVRDAADTDVRVFWRVLKALGNETEAVRPSREELCAVSIGRAKAWIEALRKRKLPVYVPDPLWRKGDRADLPPGWRRLDGEPWPGVTLLVDAAAGGYDPAVGFIGETSENPVMPIKAAPPDQTETDQEEGEETNEGYISPVTLKDHTEHVVVEAERLCRALNIGGSEKVAILRAARWHDVGKAHGVFQETMRRGLAEPARYDGVLLAKTEKQHLRHERPYFRHELASALAFLAHEKWRREADLVAYLIAAHHGKVRMSLRARPEEKLPDGNQEGARFARGIWEDDRLPPVELGDGVVCPETELRLEIMELGEDAVTGASWTERTRALLGEFGPFRLAWLEALLTIADWRASAKERNGSASSLPSPAHGGTNE